MTRFVLIFVALFAGSWVIIPSVYSQTQKRATLEVQERALGKKKIKKKTGPRLGRSEMFNVSVERKLIKGINKTLKFLSKTAKSLPKKSSQRLQIQERIFNLYIEQATYVRSEEERQYDKKWRAWDKNGQKGTEPQLRASKSIQYWKQVVNQGSAILKEFPKASTADKITYNRAAALQYLNKEAEAARLFNRLIREFPNSEILGEAYASLGDYYFDKVDYSNALKNFKAALKYKRSKRYLWSIFKMGWSSYNLSRYKDAIDYWKKLVKFANRQKKAGAAQLKEEALRDMVYAFAELKQIDHPISYYRANGGKKFIAPFLQLLSAIYGDQGDYKRAIVVLKRFQAVEPSHEGIPASQKDVVGMYSALGSYTKLWKELEYFHTLVEPRSRWARGKSKKQISEAANLVRDQVKYYASLAHKNAIEDKNRQLNKEAQKGYLLFLKLYPKGRDTAEIKYYLGDIDNFLKNYEKAGDHYKDIVKLPKARAARLNPKTKKYINIHKEAAVYMVNAYVKDFEKEFKSLKKRIPDFKKPRPISSRGENYIEACKIYEKHYPQDKNRIKSCDLGIANIYYHSGHRDDALKNLRGLATKYPTSSEGPLAINLLIPMMNKDTSRLLSLSNALLKIPAYRKGKLGGKLRGLQRGVEKESITEEKNPLERAQKFEAQARKYPKDSDVDKLWYNAAVDYVKAGAIPNAITAYLVIVKRFPKKPQARESLLQVAQIYERILDFQKASAYYLQYRKTYSRSKEAPGAFARACELQLALNTPQALDVCRSFAMKYPDGALPYVERLISGAFRAKRTTQMVNIITTMYLPKFKLTANQKIIAYYRIYTAFQGKGAEAAKAVASIQKEFARSGKYVKGEALRYVGELAFKNADAKLAPYLKVGLSGGTVERLLATIQAKAAMLQTIEAAYGVVVKTKDSYWGTAALHQIGIANEQFAELLSNPPAITGAKKEDIIKQLEPQIKQLRKAALGWYKTAHDTVSQYKVYNSYSVKIINALARITGSKVQFDDYVVTPDFFSSPVPGSLVAKVQEN